MTDSKDHGPSTTCHEGDDDEDDESEKNQSSPDRLSFLLLEENPQPPQLSTVVRLLPEETVQSNTIIDTSYCITDQDYFHAVLLMLDGYLETLEAERGAESATPPPSNANQSMIPFSEGSPNDKPMSSTASQESSSKQP